MKLVMLIAAVLIGAAPSIANAQTDNVNAAGTIGPTVTAKPDVKHGTGMLTRAGMVFAAG